MTAQALHEWLKVEREAVRKGINAARRAVWWFIATIVVSEIAILWLGNSIDFQLALVMALFQGIILVVFLGIAHQRKLALTDFRTKSNVRRVRQGELQEISQYLRALMLKLNLNDKDLVLYRQLTLHSTPAIKASHSEIAILVPVGFISIFARNPDAGKAMLAHELAHVVQHDASLWVFVGSYGNSFKNCALIFGTLNLIGMGAEAAYSHKVPNVPMGVVLMSVYIAEYEKAVHARRRSEYIADFTAAACVGPNAIYDAILQYVESDGVGAGGFDDELMRNAAGFGNMLHPPKAWRLSRIKAYAPLINQNPEVKAENAT